MTDMTREAEWAAILAAVAAHNRGLGAAHHAQYDRLPTHKKPSAPKPVDKRAKVKAARKQRRNNRG